MKKKLIEIPRHPELGVVVTLIVDIGQTYDINQKVISDSILTFNKENLEEIFINYFNQMSCEMIKHLVKEGVIPQLN